jgi:hypothetical protein
MAKERTIYHCTGLKGGEFVDGHVTATSAVEARRKFRKRYKRPVTHITTFSCYAAD